MNKEFFNIAFDEDEKQYIQLSAVQGGAYFESIDRMPSSFAIDTQDRVFVMSWDECLRYLPLEKERICMPTSYAISHGTWLSLCGNCWWLRSPGYYTDYSDRINSRGAYVSSVGMNMTSIAVRPSVWISMK